MRATAALQIGDAGIKKEGVPERIVHRILDLVKTGNLKAGDKLPAEREMIEIFGVSRPTLREAFRALSALGVVEIRHGGGAFITELDARSLLAPLSFFVSLIPENVSQTFECRRLVEVELAGKAAQSATAQDVQEFEAMLAAQMRIVDDPVAFRILDIEFHEKVYSLAGNAVMEQVALAFYNIGLEERRRATSSSKVTRQSVTDHGLIVAGIRSGDAESTRQAMLSHLDHIEKTTLEAMQFGAV
jgi:GntR family transcriptional regulator, transcriptional repressor for pyruvate dehydrogenase complex